MKKSFLGNITLGSFEIVFRVLFKGLSAIQEKTHCKDKDKDNGKDKDKDKDNG